MVGDKKINSQQNVYILQNGRCFVVAFAGIFLSAKAKKFKIRRSLLPLLGLLAVQDKINHVSVRPLYKMTEIQYQQNIRFSRQLWHIHK